MEIIRTIREEDVGTDFPTPSLYKERVAARAIVFDRDGNIALLHATKKNYHKLPGGGVEVGEDIETGLARELLEEIGCVAENLRELGIIEEYRNKFDLHQLSHCFLADLSGGMGVPDLEEDEIAEGFETVWMNLEDSIRTLEKEIGIDDYTAKFMCLRDLTFLKEAQKSTTF